MRTFPEVKIEAGEGETMRATFDRAAAAAHAAVPAGTALTWYMVGMNSRAGILNFRAAGNWHAVNVSIKYNPEAGVDAMRTASVAFLVYQPEERKAV